MKKPIQGTREYPYGNHTLSLDRDICELVEREKKKLANRPDTSLSVCNPKKRLDEGCLRAAAISNRHSETWVWANKRTRWKPDGTPTLSLFSQISGPNDPSVRDSTPFHQRPSTFSNEKTTTTDKFQIGSCSTAPKYTSVPLYSFQLIKEVNDMRSFNPSSTTLSLVLVLVAAFLALVGDAQAQVQIYTTTIPVSLI